MTNTKMTLEESLLEFQKRFEGVKKTRKNGFTNSDYASLDDVWNAAKPLLCELNIIAVDNVYYDDGRTFLRCILKLVDDDKIFESIAPLEDDKGSQIFGADLTYKKRYLKCTMLSIVETDDDDGNAGQASTNPLLTEKQHSTILDLVDATETDMAVFTEHLKKVFSVEEIEQLSIRQAGTVTNQLKAKLKRLNDG